MDVRILRIGNDSELKIYRAKREKDLITCKKLSETFKIPKKCSISIWKEGSIRQKAYELYLVGRDNPYTIDFKQLIAENIKADVYNPTEINAVLESKIISDFMKFKSGYSFWLIMGVLLGGMVAGVCIGILLNLMGFI